MKNFVTLVFVLFGLFGFSQKIFLTTNNVKNFYCSEIEVDTNGFGYVTSVYFEWLNDSENTLFFDIDIDNMIIVKTEYLNDISFKIDSVKISEDIIDITYMDYDKEKNTHYKSYISISKSVVGNYPVFINYWYEGSIVKGFLIKKNEIDINFQ